jgi:hypothetical protein
MVLNFLEHFWAAISSLEEEERSVEKRLISPFNLQMS